MPEKYETNFLSRWSRRKRQIEIEVHEAAAALDNTTGEEAQSVAPHAGTDKNQLDLASREPTEEELEMQANLEAAEAVDLGNLEYESDFEIFLKKGVPDSLKNAAMQKLWRSHPMLAVLDGLNDYDEDFGDTKLNIYKSAWEVGRGFLNDDEMNHNPVDKLKAALEKLVEDESEQAAAIATSNEAQIPADTDEPYVTESKQVQLEAVSGPNQDDYAIEQENESETPKRISLRSRLFSDADDIG